MRHSLTSALSLGAVLLLLGACSSASDQPAATAEAAPAAETQPAPEPDRAVRTTPAGGAPRAAAPATPAATRYACAGTKDALTVTHAANAATARISFGKTTVSGKRAGAGHYTAARVDLVQKGNAATLTWRGKKYSCKARA